MSKLILYTRWTIDDTDRFVIVESVSREYDGLWGECKKGRETVEQNMKADQAAATKNRANSQQAFGNTQNLVGEETASTTPGSLSPAATAQLASDRDNIARTYNGMRQTAFRTLGQRGFGSAPSGFGLASENAADQGQASQDTAAYRNAQQNTEQQRQHAMGIEAGMTGTEGSLGNGASGESTSAAVARNKMGSTFGDVMGGIGDVAGIAFPALGLAKGAIGAFSKMGSSGVGGYGPGPNGTYS